jgi:beta-glucanase (GH16 family)
MEQFADFTLRLQGKPLNTHVVAIIFIMLWIAGFLCVAEVNAEAASGIPVKGYELVWSDEFNGTTLDMTKWNYRDLGPRRDAINVKDTVSLDGKGHLVLSTKRSGNEYHTAMIGTEKKFETTFGYFECRVMLQKQIGHWSAFWLQSPKMGKEIGNTFEAGTEIDIFEYSIKNSDTVHQSLHWDGYKKDRKSESKRPQISGLSEGWHTFGLLWTDKKYVFFVDGNETWRTSSAISGQNEFIILSLEVGEWAGDISTAVLPDNLYVDYVRVYKKKKTEPKPDDAGEPAP